LVKQYDQIFNEVLSCVIIVLFIIFKVG